MSPEKRPVNPRHEQLEYLYSTQGFFPADASELSDALGLVSYLVHDEDAKDKINHAFAHNQRNLLEDNPQANRLDAVSVAYALDRKYKSYANTAHIAWTNLEDLSLQINNPDAPARDRLKFESVDNVNTIAMGMFVNFIDTLQASGQEAGGNTFLEDPLEKDYYPKQLGSQNLDEHIRNHIMEVANSLTIGEARELLAAAIAAQKSRTDFWASRVSEYKLLKAPDQDGNIAVEPDF